MENDQSLKESIDALVKYNKKLSSVWWTFLRGILYGLGFFIGSAILAAATIYVLSKIDFFKGVADFITQFK